MIEDRIRRLESTISAADDIPPERKTEVLGLLAQLKSRIEKLSETHDQDAASITGLVEASAQEATRPEKKPGLLENSLDGLKQSARGFEASHPELVESVNEFATVLANMGL
ncbi:MAG: DUF4404 family protein [Chthoniobacterales bacterium]